MIARQKKREKLVAKYKEKRQNLKNKIKKTEFLDQKLAYYEKLQKLPRNSSSVRLNNRCMITGRPQGFYRDFGLSRQVLRTMAHQCLLPGVTKSSW